MSARVARVRVCLLLPLAVLPGAAVAAEEAAAAAAAEPVEVRPRRIDDVLANPNTGLADFHMG